jgi:hypothetical protein
VALGQVISPSSIVDHDVGHREECALNPSPQLRKEPLMLFMAIFNYSPEDRNLVIERGMGGKEKDIGVTVKGEWFDISGHRVFRLFEADDEIHLASSIYNWTDLGVAEIIPVMETEKALKLIKRTLKKS